MQEELYCSSLQAILMEITALKLSPAVKMRVDMYPCCTTRSPHLLQSPLPQNLVRLLTAMMAYGRRITKPATTRKCFLRSRTTAITSVQLPWMNTGIHRLEIISATVISNGISELFHRINLLLLFRCVC